MANEIKDLLDSIINDTEKAYSGKNAVMSDDENKLNHDGSNPVTFDKGEFKEKLSLFVLSDIVHAMMHDETKDLDGMIDDSIMKHIHDDYKGTCYGYLTDARDRLKSPIIGDLVQEMDEATDEVAEELEETKDPDVADDFDMSELLKNVDNYEDLRIKLKDIVSKKVVDDVAGVITKSNDAPVFDDLDEKLEEEDNNEENTPDATETAEDEAGTAPAEFDTTENDSDQEITTTPDGEETEVANDDTSNIGMNDENDTTNESVILRMCGSIVTESAIVGKRISTEEGLNRAIINYCLEEMDYLFKARSAGSIYHKYL